MSNPMLKNLNTASQAPAQMPASNSTANIFQRFMQFKNQIGSQNPQQIVQNLISSGQMSEQQFAQLKQQAQTMLSMFK